jgi:replicative DNA helicase
VAPLLPHSKDAEEAVLGSVFTNPLALGDVVTFLKPHDFYRPAYRHVYAALLALFERGAGIDYHTVADALVRHGTYQAAGGVLAMSELNVATPTSAHIVHYARIVADTALRRRFVDAAQRVTELACDLRQEINGVRQRSTALMPGAPERHPVRPRSARS